MTIFEYHAEYMKIQQIKNNKERKKALDNLDREFGFK